jgi:two-component system sensor histidine kinase VicK
MVFYILFVGLMVILTLLFARSTRQRLEADIKAADLALARSIAQETDVEMRNAIQAVQELSAMEAVISSRPEEMEELFKTVLKARPDISYIHRINSQGFMLYHYPSGQSSFIGSDFSYQDYFQRAQVTTRALISKGSISPITNQPVASAVMPIWDESAHFRGLVATNIKLESLSLTLQKIANEYKPEEGFQVVIIDSTGQVIAHPDPNLLLTELPNSQMEIVNAVLLGKVSNSIKEDGDGKEYLYSYVPISRSGWGVIVSRPTSKAFASSQSFFQGVLLILIIFLIAGVSFWIGLNHLAIQPLGHLVAYSQTIGQDNRLSDEQAGHLERLSQRPDQVGHLTNSLIRMEKNIEDRLNELSTLLQTSAYVLSSLDSQTVLDRILNQVEQLLNVEMSSIVALDERRGVFRIQASHGISNSHINSPAVNPKEPQSVTSLAIQYGKPFQISNIESDSLFQNITEQTQSIGYRSTLAIPLNTQHSPPSVLLVFRSDPHIFIEQEITLLSNFANQAAMAIENATLFARSDTRLQTQTRRLEALIQSLNDGLILGNLEGKILYANQSVCEWVNLHHEDILGSSLDAFIDELLITAVEPESSREEIQTAIKNMGTSLAEISIMNKGEERHLRIRIFNVTDSKNLAIGYGLIFQDITADYELDRMKSSLISTVSHELRTPLASIKGYTTTLLADDVKWDFNSQKEFLHIISDETDRLSTLVNDLLDLSRIEAGDTSVNLSECDFNELVERAAKRAYPPPKDRLRLQIASDLPHIEIDIRRIEVVMRNLIENATKYAGADSPILVSAELENGSLIVRVQDEGPGIPFDENEKIFQSFYRLEDNASHRSSGLGLGLSICQGFVKAHGGEIWSELCDTGACIGFSLPINPPMDNTVYGRPTRTSSG